MSFSENLKKYRKQRGLTQAELAAAIGAGVHTVKMWEGGKHEPNVGMVVKLCELFDISAQELVTGSPVLADLTIEAPAPAPADNRRVEFIDEIMETDGDTLNRLIKYYEFLKKEKGDH